MDTNSPNQDMTQMLKLIVDMNNNIKRLETKIDKLETIISTHCDIDPVIDQPIVPVNDPNNYTKTPRIFKKEKFDFDEDIVRKILEKSSQSGDFEIFKLMYTTNENSVYPLRKVKTDYQYWNGDNFISDPECEFIKSVLTSNIRHCYVRVNKYSDMNLENADKFIKNQEHIEKLNDPKYINKLVDNIFKKL